MSKISKRSTILMPSAEEDKAITAAAKSDPDAQPHAKATEWYQSEPCLVVREV